MAASTGTRAARVRVGRITAGRPQRPLEPTRQSGFGRRFARVARVGAQLLRAGVPDRPLAHGRRLGLLLVRSRRCAGSTRSSPQTPTSCRACAMHAATVGSGFCHGPRSHACTTRRARVRGHATRSVLQESRRPPRRLVKTTTSGICSIRHCPSVCTSSAPTASPPNGWPRRTVATTRFLRRADAGPTTVQGRVFESLGIRHPGRFSADSPALRDLLGDCVRADTRRGCHDLASGGAAQRRGDACARSSPGLPLRSPEPHLATSPVHDHGRDRRASPGASAGERERRRAGCAAPQPGAHRRELRTAVASRQGTRARAEQRPASIGTTSGRPCGPSSTCRSWSRRDRRPSARA